MTAAPVLVIGDVMLDETIHGDMRRIAQEAPVPVVRQMRTEAAPGGAANVAATLAALGRRCMLLGVVGEDFYGQQLAQMLPRDYFVTSLLLKRPRAVTVVKTRIVCGGHPVLRVDTEAQAPGLSDADTDRRLLEAAAAAFAEETPPGLLVLSDYAKGTLSAGTAGQLLTLARRQGVATIVDCRPDHVTWYAGATLLKPNLAEALEMLADDTHPALYAESASPVDKALTAGRKLRERHGFAHVVITAGAHGAVYSGADSEFAASVTQQAVFDVQGAGDTFLAALADSVLAGDAMPRALLRANTAAGVAVSQPGTYVVSRSALDAAVRKRLGPAGKLLTPLEAMGVIRQLRDSNRRSVLANGCFRTLHHGHMTMLQWARQQGDALIVAMNSDASIRRLKGDVRIVPQAARAELLAALEYVDYVVVFDDISVERLIRELRPDVLVKGAQYQGQNVPGADFVAACGGAVKFAPMVPDASSTAFDND